MANITFKNVDKVYRNGVKAVDNFNMEINDQDFVIMVGPSGCGKSTTLRMLAGLEEITAGEVYIDDVLVNDIHPKDRDIAMVFQNYALYAHMTVFDNMAFGLKIRKLPKEEIRQKVLEAAKILDIEHLLDRRPAQLSGGQRQRVALGRAIVRNPKVFLMDEPLSNLDAKLRVQMRAEICELQYKLKATVIYVTHDQVEAMTMGTKIVVMNHGVIQQIGSPSELYNYPNNLFVAGFIGSPQMNFVEMTVVESQKSGRIRLKTDGAEFVLPEDKGQLLKDKGYVGKSITCGIRPEDMYVITDGSVETTADYILSEREETDRDALINSRFKATVDVIEMLGADKQVFFKVAGKNCVAKTSAKSNVKRKSEIQLMVNTSAVHLFDTETELAIR